jgi:hypothetical protein
MEQMVDQEEVPKEQQFMQLKVQELPDKETMEVLELMVNLYTLQEEVAVELQQ